MTHASKTHVYRTIHNPSPLLSMAQRVQDSPAITSSNNHPVLFHLVSSKTSFKTKRNRKYKMAFIFISHTLTYLLPQFRQGLRHQFRVSPPPSTLRVASFGGPRRGAPTHSRDRIVVPVVRHLSTPDQKMGLKAT